MIAKHFTGISFRDFSENKKRKSHSLNINFSIVNQCNCYQICYRNFNFVTISRDMQYTGTSIIL